MGAEINANSPNHTSCCLGTLLTKMEFTRPKGKVAISALKAVTELRRFMGMVNQMSKFLPNIAQISKPLHDPLKHQEFLGMGHSPREVLQKLKEEISYLHYMM